MARLHGPNPLSPTCWTTRARHILEFADLIYGQNSKLMTKVCKIAPPLTIPHPHFHYPATNIVINHSASTVLLVLFG